MRERGDCFMFKIYGNISINKIIIDLFSRSNTYTFNIEGGHMKLILFIFLFPIFVYCQTAVIKGKVVAKGNEEKLVGADVHLLGTNIGCPTDKNGNYEIKNILPGKYKVRCSYIGAKNQDKIIDVKQNDSLVVNYKLMLINADSLKYKLDPNHIVPLSKK